MASGHAPHDAKVVSLAALAAAAAGSMARGGTGAAKAQTTMHADELLQVLRCFCGKPSTASWVVAAGVNAAVLGYVSYKLYRSAIVQQDKYKQLKRSAQRLWRLATQGGAAAGEVAQDLGEPDASGVYTITTATSTLYFRQSQAAPFQPPHWEWSTDRVLWIPTCFADSLWYSSDSSPSTADKVLIRRLEVEARLLAQQSGGGSSAAAAGSLLPPLDVSQSRRDLSCLADVPTAFLCPISMRLMTQPVVTPSGATFDRPALLDWIRQTHTDPVSGQPLSSDQLVSNLVVRDMIHAWLQGDTHSTSNNTTNTATTGSSDSSSVGEPAAPPAAAAINTGGKAERAASVKGCGGGRDVCMTPGTPVRASRDV